MVSSSACGVRVCYMSQYMSVFVHNTPLQNMCHLHRKVDFAQVPLDLLAHCCWQCACSIAVILHHEPRVRHSTSRSIRFLTAYILGLLTTAVRVLLSHLIICSKCWLSLLRKQSMDKADEVKLRQRYLFGGTGAPFPDFLSAQEKTKT